MKVVVIGGTGLIGSKVVAKLNQHGHEAIAGAPNTRVDTLTGEGLAEVPTGAQVVVDVANSPSFEDGPAWDFFTTATAMCSPQRSRLDDHTLVPGPNATVFATRFEDWLIDNAPAPVR